MARLPIQPELPQGKGHGAICSLVILSMWLLSDFVLIFSFFPGSREYPDLCGLPLTAHSPGNNWDSAGGPVLAGVWHLQPEIPQGVRDSQIFLLGLSLWLASLRVERSASDRCYILDPEGYGGARSS